MNAKEFWIKKFEEKPQSDTDRLTIVMMTEYAESKLKTERDKIFDIAIGIAITIAQEFWDKVIDIPQIDNKEFNESAMHGARVVRSRLQQEKDKEKLID